MAAVLRTQAPHWQGERTHGESRTATEASRIGGRAGGVPGVEMGAQPPLQIKEMIFEGGFDGLYSYCLEDV